MTPEHSTIFGAVFVQLDQLGIASYHFDSEEDCTFRSDKLSFRSCTVNAFVLRGCACKVIQCVLKYDLRYLMRAEAALSALKPPAALTAMVSEAARTRGGYLSYAAAPADWRLDDGSAPPAKKPFQDARYDPETRWPRGADEPVGISWCISGRV